MSKSPPSAPPSAPKLSLRAAIVLLLTSGCLHYDPTTGPASDTADSNPSPLPSPEPGNPNPCERIVGKCTPGPKPCVDPDAECVQYDPCEDGKTCAPGICVKPLEGCDDDTSVTMGDHVTEGGGGTGGGTGGKEESTSGEGTGATTVDTSSTGTPEDTSTSSTDTSATIGEE